MEYFFYPSDENEFKKRAVGKFVRTIIFNTIKTWKKTEIKNEKGEDVENPFCRKVRKCWKNSRKNNIESDKRIKDLKAFIKRKELKDHYQIYSWVAESDRDFGLPFFAKQD